MSWFDDAENESESLHFQSDSIYRESENVSALLWKAINKEISTLASDKRVHILTNGSSFDRTLRHQIIPTQNTQNTLREMHIKLSLTTRQITADAPSNGNLGESHVVFDLEFFEDGAVHLMHEHARIEMKDAAIMILRNLLFPHLPLKAS